MLRAVLLLCALAALCVLPCAGQSPNYEFCYILQGGSSSANGGYAVTAHGFFYTTGSGSTVTITNTNVTRSTVNALGQRYTEYLAGIVPANNRVDTNLYIPPSPGYVDGSGIQMPIAATFDPVNGVGSMLLYNIQSQPFVFVTNSLYGLTSQLNSNINLLYSGTQYGERLDAGGVTITADNSTFRLQAYSASSPITNCVAAIYQPACVNYPATPPSGSVLFNITLSQPWTSLPATYISDLLTALTVAVAPANTQARFLGLFLFSCFPILTKTAGARPQVWFYLNSQSVVAMGLSMDTVVQQVYSALQPSSTALNSNGYLPASEQGLVVAANCPIVYNGGAYPNVAGCSSGGVVGSSPNYEFCYVLRGGASSANGGFAVWAHGYFYTTGSGGTVTITNTNVTRNTVNALGQRYTEYLAGIVLTNSRVDQNLYVTPNPGYVDGSGIQLPIAAAFDPINGVGSMLLYNIQTQPFVYVTNTGYGLTSQLNNDINLLYSGSRYGERLDAGGTTIGVTTSTFTLQPYSASSPVACAAPALYQPLCVNYPATPPDNSVLFNITLGTPWTSLPATYINDLLTALTVSVAGNNNQAKFLGLFLFSCFPVLTKNALSRPQVWFFLNSQSASLMGLSLTSVVQQVYNALQPSATTLNSNGYLPASEQGLIVAVACPSVYNGGLYAGVAGCSAAATVSSSSSSTGVVAGGGGGTTDSSSSGSSGLSHGAIAGVVIGSVVGALLLCVLLFALMRRMSSPSTDKQPASQSAPNHARFENESSQVSTAPRTTDGVELA